MTDDLKQVSPVFSSSMLTKVIAPDSTLNPAKWMHERIVRSIASFEEDLDREHEVGAHLVSFGADVTFHIQDVGYWGPDIIRFYGVDNSGRNVELLQHISQLSVLLVAIAKRDTEPRRIGFEMVSKLTEK